MNFNSFTPDHKELIDLLGSDEKIDFATIRRRRKSRKKRN